MAYSQLMQTYLGTGTLANRPATPNVAAGVSALYYGTDVNILYAWSGTSWMSVTAAGGVAAPVNLISPAASTVPLSITGAASQSADLTQWVSSTGSVLGKVSAAGGLTASTLGLVNVAPATVPLTVTAAASQTADLQQWRSSTGTVLASVNASGIITGPELVLSDAGLYIGPHRLFRNASTAALTVQLQNFTTASFVIQSSNATTTPLISQAAASQTADLQQWQSSTSAVLAKVDSSGAIAPQNGARITSGSGAPTKPGGLNPVAGDIYHRTDTPGTSLQNIYKCTVGGATPTWVGIV